MRLAGWLRGMMLLGGLLLGMTPSTQAGIVVESVIIEQIPDPVWEVQLQIKLDAGSEIRLNDYFTIYDLPGLILGSNNQPGPLWTVDTSNFPLPYLGITPVGLNPVDSPTLFNITWKYIGDDTIRVPAGQTSLLIGTFKATLITDLDKLPNSLVFAQSSHKPNGDPDRTTGTVPVQIITIPIPEPSASVLLAMGGLGLLAVRSIRRRR